jgi:hypothetical protein
MIRVRLEEFQRTDKIRCKVKCKGGSISSSNPYIAEQTALSKDAAPCCARCGRFLGSTDFQLEYVLKRYGNSNIRCIADGCNEMYCSDKCVKLRRTDGHWLTCSASIRKRRSYKMTRIFLEHALSTNELFSVAFQVVSKVASDTLSSFCHYLHYEMCREGSSLAERRFIESLGRKFEQFDALFPCYGRTLWGPLDSDEGSALKSDGEAIQEECEIEESSSVEANLRSQQKLSS